MNLVQVGEGQWVNPSEIVAVSHFPEREICQKKICANVTPKHLDGKYTISYWPVGRVMRALGLVDKTWIHEVWERTS